MKSSITFLAFTAFVAMAMADKPEVDLLKTSSVSAKLTAAKKAQIVSAAAKASKEAAGGTSEKKVKIVTADKRSDVVVQPQVDEKSDIYEAASQSSYEAGAPVSQGNLYYYYYPVAAYPVHADDKVSSSGSSGSSVLDSPLIFLLVPLVLLLIAVPVVSLLTSNTR